MARSGHNNQWTGTWSKVQHVVTQNRLGTAITFPNSRHKLVSCLDMLVFFSCIIHL